MQTENKKKQPLYGSSLSYVLSVFIIIPFLRLGVEHYNLSIFYLLILSSLTLIVVNYILQQIESCYSFSGKILKNKIFLFYLLFCFTLENFWRKK